MTRHEDYWNKDGFHDTSAPSVEPAPQCSRTLDTLEESLHTASEFPVAMMATMKALTADIEFDIDDSIEGAVVIQDL